MVTADLPPHSIRIQQPLQHLAEQSSRGQSRRKRMNRRIVAAVAIPASQLLQLVQFCLLLLQEPVGRLDFRFNLLFLLLHLQQLSNKRVVFGAGGARASRRSSARSSRCRTAICNSTIRLDEASLPSLKSVCCCRSCRWRDSSASMSASCSWSCFSASCILTCSPGNTGSRGSFPLHGLKGLSLQLRRLPGLDGMLAKPEGQLLEHVIVGAIALIIDVLRHPAVHAAASHPAWY